MKSKKFIPPTKEEVVQFFAGKGVPALEAVYAWEHYEYLNWCDSYGTPVLSWRAKMNTNWIRTWKKKNNGTSKRFSKPKTGADIYADSLSELLSGKN